MSFVFQFDKYQATGNDFIIFSDPNLADKICNQQMIKRLCDRKYGIGADGLILLEESENEAFIFNYYNADGSRGEMCGNGCRAAILNAFDKNWVEREKPFSFLADDGLHKGIIHSVDAISLTILSNDMPHEIETKNFELPPWVTKIKFVNTGVPHLIVFYKGNLTHSDILKWGRYLRLHPYFAPAGCNVNFIKEEAGKTIIRTYERGVENETESCGTGITASALAIAKSDVDEWVTQLKALGGNVKVERKKNKLYLRGPARHVFSGQMNL